MRRKRPSAPRRAPKRAPAVSRAEQEAWALQWPQKAAEGYFLDSQGYVARMERTAGRRKYVREHRLVMEAMLGRPLVRGENVHHLNGDRTDNRPDNLELWATCQPAGQRPEDLLVWAYEIIERYGASPDASRP